MDKVVLASNSPRRKEILNRIGIRFQIIPSNINEHLDLNFSPTKIAKYWSIQKTKNISEKYRDNIIIGADTIVSLNNEVFGKPFNKDHSIEILKKLSGNIHEVITGVSIAHFNKNIFTTFSKSTNVKVKNIPIDQINYYVNNFNTLDKAGAYGIQDWFSIWIDKINGCYYNVLGLPVSDFYYHYNQINKNLT